MNRININLMERHLLLSDRFIDKSVESGFSEKDITEKSYLFCAGFYIKYQTEIEKLAFSNREVVSDLLLLSYYSYINRIDNDMLDKGRMRDVCSSLTNFIISSGSRTEKVYAHERKKYKSWVLKRELSMKDKRKKYGP